MSNKRFNENSFCMATSMVFLQRNLLLVVKHLLKETFTTACRKNQVERFLDRSFFLRIFEEETTSRVPMHQLQALTKAAGTTMGALLGAIGGASFQAVLPIQTDLPPLQVSLAPREQLVAELEAQITHSGVLVLTGSTGIGKTTLTKLVTRSVGGNWYWLNVSSNRDPVQLSERCQHNFLFL